MQRAYGLLGVLFLVVFGGAFWAFQYAHAPESETQTYENIDYQSNGISMLTLTSPVFEDGGAIPAKYTCDGQRFLNPPLLIGGVPPETESLVLVMDDPDIPDVVKESRGIQKFDHWILYNISPSTREINEGHALGSQGLNSAGSQEYTGPCPPKDFEPTKHRYVFRLYALSGSLNFIKTPTLDEVEMAAKGIAIESATLTGTYERE